MSSAIPRTNKVYRVTMRANKFPAIVGITTDRLITINACATTGCIASTTTTTSDTNVTSLGLSSSRKKCPS